MGGERAKVSSNEEGEAMDFLEGGQGAWRSENNQSFSRRKRCWFGRTSLGKASLPHRAEREAQKNLRMLGRKKVGQEMADMR